MLKVNQKGFTVLEALLILVIIGILGGTGWYVWNTHNKTTDTLTNADSANASVTKYSRSVIHVKELGIKFEAPDSIKGLIYMAKDDRAYFSTKSLTSKDKGCDPGGVAPPLGSLSRTNGQYPKDATVDNASGALVKQFTDFYIAYRAPQSACSVDNSVNQIASIQKATFRTAVESLSQE